MRDETDSEMITREKYTHIFDKVTNSNQIREGVLLAENTSGDFSFCREYGGKTADSPLLMASITKLFTTACILALHGQGRLSLDDKVAGYFDKDMVTGLHVYFGREYSFDLTIADLLFQVSGLPDIFTEGKDNYKNRVVHEDFSLTFDELVLSVKKLQPHFAPRTSGKAFYADINFDLLGEIIEKVTCSSLAEAYTRFIFEPLGLKNTYLPESDADFIPNIYYKNTSLYRPEIIRSSRASGGCISTARELMIFMKAFFGGKLFDKDIPDSLPGCNRLQFSMGPVCYGCGYMRIPLRGWITFFRDRGEAAGHSGSTGSFAFYYPEKDMFFAGDLNQMGNSALPIRFVIKLVLVTE